MTIGQSFELAQQHHQAGRLKEAEHLYRQILAQEPMHADALHLLGLLTYQLRQFDIAVNLIRRSIEIAPNNAPAHSNLGEAFRAQGRIDQAIEACRQAIALDPKYANAHANLGVALEARENFGEAIIAYRQAIALKPGWPEGYFNLGNALRKNHDLNDAIVAYRHAVALRPSWVEAHYSLGDVLVELGRTEDAISQLQAAIALNSNVPETFNRLGFAFQSIGGFDDAIAAYRNAITLDPKNPVTHNNLGVALQEKELLDESIDSFQEAIALDPDDAEAHDNLGVSLQKVGRPEQAVAAHRRAIALKSSAAPVHHLTNLLHALHHDPGCDAKQFLEESRQWAARQPVLSPNWTPMRDQRPDRKLKIGYLSPFFILSPESHFLLPLLSYHDRGGFEIWCYSRSARHDEFTKRLRTHADRWFDVASLGIHQAVELIRGHEIDILVNISRPADDCLRILASRVAPVQANWLTFGPFTTGLATMDYRISDTFIDPIGMDESCYSEKTLRLPKTAWCYDPLVDLPQPPPLPAVENGFITFGSLNRFNKINPQVVATWARVLQLVAKSKIRIVAVGGRARHNLLAQFERFGIESARIHFIDRSTMGQYMKQYDHIDIMLDTFPYGGHTTVFDALWRGVPVVLHLGNKALGRAGYSALQNLDMGFLVGKTVDEYVAIAVGLARDLPRLSQLRSTLRRRMEQSRLMDGHKFSLDMQAAYREMWQRWCKQAVAVADD